LEYIKATSKAYTLEELQKEVGANPDWAKGLKPLRLIRKIWKK
jgi:hypothetical protein